MPASGIAAATASGDLGRVLARRERRFAAALLAPAFLALLATTTLPLMFLVGTSAFRMDLAMPFADGFVGFENYRTLLADERFWSSLLVSLIYTGSTVVLQVALGLALALLVMDMKRGQGWFRLIAILPVVLSPAVVGMIWRTFMLAPEFGIVDYPRDQRRPRQQELARRSAAGDDFGRRHPYLAMDALCIHGAAGKPGVAAGRYL